MPSAKSGSRRQSDFRDRQKKKGLREIIRWVPESKIEKLDKYIDRLRKEAQEEQK